MSTKEDQALIGRAMMDPDFRKRLLSDPEATIKAEDLSVSSDLLEQLGKMDAKTAEQVGRLIGAVFGQSDPSELKDDEAAQVAGGIGIQQIGQPQLQPTQQPYLIDPGRFRAPTTW